VSSVRRREPRRSSSCRASKKAPIRLRGFEGALREHRRLVQPARPRGEGASSPRVAALGYRVVAPYLRGYGTTRFLSDETVRNGEQAASGRPRRPDGRARDRARNPGRLRLGRADRRHRCCALAGALHQARVGERVSDRKPGSGKAAAASGGRASVPTITLEGDANGAPHPTRAPTPANSRARMCTGRSRAASATTSRRRLRRRSRTPSSRSATMAENVAFARDIQRFRTWIDTGFAP
jgi:hypothetical protein